VEIVGSGHLEFDRDINTRSIHTLRIDLQQVDHINIFALVGATGGAGRWV